MLILKNKIDIQRKANLIFFRKLKFWNFEILKFIFRDVWRELNLQGKV